MQNFGYQATHWLEQALQAHLSETLEKAGCSLAVFVLLKAQASKETTEKVIGASGGTGFSLAFYACGLFLEIGIS